MRIGFFAAASIAGLLLTGVAIAGAPSATKPRPSPTAAVHAPSGRKDALSPIARGLISTRMDRHAQEMTDLLWAVVFLENTEAAAIADEIAGEPRLARPTGSGDEPVSEGIPEKFFLLQDQLRERAKDLSDAARMGNDAEIAKSFGRLNETCVTCHAEYLD